MFYFCYGTVQDFFFFLNLVGTIHFLIICPLNFSVWHKVFGSSLSLPFWLFFINSYDLSSSPYTINLCLLSLFLTCHIDLSTLLFQRPKFGVYWVSLLYVLTLSNFCFLFLWFLSLLCVSLYLLYSVLFLLLLKNIEHVNIKHVFLFWCKFKKLLHFPLHAIFTDSQNYISKHREIYLYILNF